MKRFAAWLLLSALVLVPAAPLQAAPLPFPDMEWTWYRTREAVDYLKNASVIGGYSDGTFRPKETINRAEFLKIVFAGKSGAPAPGTNCFSDVPADAWYAPYICAAKNRKVVHGYADGSFKPETPVNTAEALKILLLAYGRKLEDALGEKWYEPYVAELDRTDVLPRSSYIPWDPLTRERAADLLWRVLRYDEDRIQPSLSPGCGKAPPHSAPATVTVNGVERSFLLTVPKDYKSHDPYPLIVAFHGRTNPNTMVRQYFGLDRSATDSFVAYPAAISNGKGSFSWADGGDKGLNVRDVKLFDAIVEELALRYCIDMDAIRTVGHSLGAWMANTVACARGGAVQASATIGGDGVQGDCPGPAAALVSHNPKDNLAPYDASVRERDLRLKENGCPGTVANDDAKDSLNCVTYTNCTSGTVVWCPHTVDTDERGQFYPHTWPKAFTARIKSFFSSLR